MFFNKSLLTVIATAAAFVGSASAFTGTATKGFTAETSNCGCPPFNGPLGISIPVELIGSHRCCQDSITISYNGKTVPAVFSGNYTGGAGTQNIELTDFAFGVLEDNDSQTTLSPVTWSFNV
ncbi:hypothetical protein R3P38DRAFT_2883114 [Favolaschia claudopus]|uniref:Uncharacterized protein n=1 Tax=Favolaschia claudopus TaxID=2862362 RepID=A0AAW0D3W0_9AGAR